MKYIVIPDGKKNTSFLKDVYLHVINPRSMCSEKMFEIPCLWFVMKKEKNLEMKGVVYFLYLN